MTKFSFTLKTLICAVLKKPFKHLFSMILCILHSVLSVAVTVVLQKYLDYSVNATGSVNYISVLGLGGVLIWSMISMLLNNYFYDVVKYDVEEVIAGKLYHNISTAPFEQFEDTKFLDDVQKSKEGIQAYLSLYALVYMLFFFYIPYFILLESFYYTMNSKLMLVVLIVFIPEILSQILRVRMYSSHEDKTVPLMRRHELFERYSIDREFFKETRVFGAIEYFIALINKNLYQLAKQKMHTEFKNAFLQIILKAITLCGFAISLVFIIDEFKKDSISVGAFAGVFQSLFLSLSYIDEIVRFHFSELSKKIGKIQNYNKVCTYEYKPVNINSCVKDTIEFNNVCYCYPGKNDQALRNINFSVNKGETIAIVGYNGAGKSTLAKLILGLIQPSCGKIKFSNSFVNDGKLCCSAIFQDFEKYKMTVAENVSIGNHFETEEKDIITLLKNSGVEISSFPDKEDTLLAPEFGGIDISGGQWQRLGIARAVSKEHEILVLDEPTSAIDPLEETQLYHLFKQMGKNKTMFIITHRIGAAQLADRIFVVEKGQIVEEGTHEFLLKKKGLYSTMYHEQSKWYK